MNASRTRIVVDACTWLNLLNGGVIRAILELPFELCIGPLTIGECGSGAAQLQQLVADGSITQLDDSSLPAVVFVDLLDKYGLGDGETECLALAKQDSLTVATDDRAARRATRKELGEGRLTGTMGLLRRAVACSLLTAAEAHDVYRRMVRAGGFLPTVNKEWFAGQV